MLRLNFSHLEAGLELSHRFILIFVAFSLAKWGWQKNMLTDSVKSLDCLYIPRWCKTMQTQARPLNQTCFFMLVNEYGIRGRIAHLPKNDISKARSSTFTETEKEPESSYSVNIIIAIFFVLGRTSILNCARVLG